jgi:hypothetical protein
VFLRSTTCSSETSVDYEPATRRYISEHRVFQTHTMAVFNFECNVWDSWRQVAGQNILNGTSTFVSECWWFLYETIPKYQKGTERILIYWTAVCSLVTWETGTGPEVIGSVNNVLTWTWKGTIVRYEVLTAVTMKNGVFWDVTPCGSCKNRRFGGT